MRLIAIVCAMFLFAGAASAATSDMQDLARAITLLERRDFVAALKIITPKAEAGDPVAQYYLSGIYDGGFGYKPVKDAESLMWNKRAAEQGLREAQASLGDKFYDGRAVVKQDFAEALKWYHLSADQGFAPAQRALGEMYEAGHGVPANPGEAFKFYAAAAEQGHALAQVDTGRMYALGSGVVKDDAAAVKYFRMAANQRNSAAAIWLGSAYETGSGVEKDLALAYMWSALAGDFSSMRDTVAEPISGIAIILDNLKYDMTPDQVALAQQMVKDWKPDSGTR